MSKHRDPHRAWQITIIALVLAAAATGIAMAQAAGGDIIGAQQASNSAITIFRAIGLAAVGYGLVRFMGGHPASALTSMVVGGIALGKTTAIASYFGF